MIGWNPSYNWTYTEFRNVIDKAFGEEGLETVSLDMEHSDRKNMNDIIAWAKGMGYNAVEASGGDIIRVMR